MNSNSSYPGRSPQRRRSPYQTPFISGGAALGQCSRGFEYIEWFYNAVRLHFSLGLLSLTESEGRHNPTLRYLDVKERGIALIVFDTLSHLWPVEKENDNGEIQSAIMPLRGLSELGASVLAVHHAGATGARSRGGTELEGFFDQLAHMELTTPTDPSCRNRKLTVRGRLTSSPERIEMSLNQEGDDYQVTTGNLKPIRSGIWQSIVKLIPIGEPGITIRELRGAWYEGGEVPSENTILQTMLRCADKAGVRRSEDRPARWWMAN